jgi:hypothetical protein
MTATIILDRAKTCAHGHGDGEAVCQFVAATGCERYRRPVGDRPSFLRHTSWRSLGNQAGVLTDLDSRDRLGQQVVGRCG